MNVDEFRREGFIKYSVFFNKREKRGLKPEQKQFEFTFNIIFN